MQSKLNKIQLAQVVDASLIIVGTTISALITADILQVTDKYKEEDKLKISQLLGAILNQGRDNLLEQLLKRYDNAM